MNTGEHPESWLYPNLVRSIIIKYFFTSNILGHCPDVRSTLSVEHKMLYLSLRTVSLNNNDLYPAGVHHISSIKLFAISARLKDLSELASMSYYVLLFFLKVRQLKSLLRAFSYKTKIKAVLQPSFFWHLRKTSVMIFSVPICNLCKAFLPPRKKWYRPGGTERWWVHPTYEEQN